MNINVISNIRFILLALGFCIASNQAWAITDISACGVINKPGSYRVTRDMTHFTSRVSSQCILIEANDVTLDLQGHTITGDGSGSGITVSGNTSLSNIEVRNGTVKSFETGVYMLEVKGAHIERMRVHDNSNIGILVENHELPDVGAIIIDNVAYENFTGINVGSDSLVRGNVTNYNRFAGISVLCPSLVSDNVANNNGDGKNNIFRPRSSCIYSNNVPPIIFK